MRPPLLESRCQLLMPEVYDVSDSHLKHTLGTFCCRRLPAHRLPACAPCLRAAHASESLPHAPWVSPCLFLPCACRTLIWNAITVRNIELGAHQLQP